MVPAAWEAFVVEVEDAVTVDPGVTKDELETDMVVEDKTAMEVLDDVTAAVVSVCETLFEAADTLPATTPAVPYVPKGIAFSGAILTGPNSARGWLP